MSTQLGLFKAEKTDPRIAELIDFLRDRGWLTRKQLGEYLKWDDRLIRSIVEASEGQILSGQKGYKLTVQSTREEFECSCSQLSSQIKANTHRLNSQRKIFHRGVPTKQEDIFKEPSHYSYGA